ncbi:hypothetical protein ACH4TP_16835 [Streptomyces sp. NPDC021012]|uniref:hypothetical protein n=1 Tax=Streptomyces sp. NPDC021012 TaxID=3365107 RepID=UPI0037A86087
MGHSSMSAHRLPATTLLAAFAATTAIAWAAAGRRRGAPAIAGALLLLQGALHLLFSTAGGHARESHAAVPGLGNMPGMESMDAMDSMGVGMTMGTPTPMSSGAGMLAVHLLAALLCGVWLARGEAAFFTLARAALAYAFTPLRLIRALVPVAGTPRRPVRRARRNARRPRTVVLAHTLSRRGPPRLSAPRATALGAHV